MKIESYEDLDKLVAQSLGWQQSIYSDLFNGDIEISFYHPSDLIGADVLDQWFIDYGIAPKFCECWRYAEEFLLPECDRRNLGIEWRRSPQSIVCVIAALTERYYPGVMVHTGAGFKYPRSMNLATCLAWLHFNSVAFSWEIKVNQ